MRKIGYLWIVVQLMKKVHHLEPEGKKVIRNGSTYICMILTVRVLHVSFLEQLMVLCSLARKYL